MKAKFLFAPAALLLLSAAPSRAEWVLEGSVEIGTSSLWCGQQLGGAALKPSLSLTTEFNDLTWGFWTELNSDFGLKTYLPFADKAPYNYSDFGLSLGWRNLELLVYDEIYDNYFVGENHNLISELSWTAGENFPLCLTLYNALLYSGGGISTYIKAEYPFEIGNFSLSPEVIAVPHTSYFIDDIEGFHVTSLLLNGGYEISLSDSLSMPLTIQAGYSPAYSSPLLLFSAGIAF